MEEEILEIRQGEYYARLPRRVFSQEVIAKILQIFVDLEEKYPSPQKNATGCIKGETPIPEDKTKTKK